MFKNYKDKDRYQFQSWYIKLWRRRHYLYIPIDTIKSWLRSSTSLRNCFSIAIGWAQIKMGWTYTSEEIDKELK